jgi:serine/threonine protein kinase/CHASE2 domain-containing sensor protein
MQTATQKLSKDTLRRGLRVDAYTLLERIGFGGEAEIWSAWHEEGQRVVVMKFIRSAFNASGQERINQDFAKQVRLIATLKHQNILPIYSHGVIPGHFHYFVMRYAPLGSLENRLQAGPLPLAEALPILAQITAALSFLHERDIIHRDLKPSNILMDSQNRVYLSDFGLAKTISDQTLPMHTGRGTMAYAPFEQHNRLTVKPQSDIYSLGILIFETLTGKLPWAGAENLASRQFMFDQNLPDLSEYNLDLPAPLTAALRQLTAFHWGERPATAAEAFQLLLQAVDVNPKTFNQRQTLLDSFPDETTRDWEDARYLLERFLAGWRPKTMQFPARLSHLALIDSVHVHHELAFTPYPAWELFMLRGALTYDYSLRRWPRQAPDPQQQWLVSEQTLLLEEPPAVSRALAQMDALSKAGEAPFAPDAVVLARLLELATEDAEPEQLKIAWRILDRTVSPSAEWRALGVSRQVDGNLADLALSEGQHASQAARLIGKMGSLAAISIILESVSFSRTLSSSQRTLFQDIYQAAGGLPPQIPMRIYWQVRGRLYRDWLRQEQIRQVLGRAAIGLVVGLLFNLMMQAGWFERPSAQLRDSLLDPYPTSDIVAIVAVDDASLAHYGRWDSWPRSLHTQLIEQLQTMGAAVIVFDLLFEAVTPDDASLSQAMQSAGNVALPVLGFGDGLKLTPGAMSYEQLLWPQPDLLAASAGVGHTNILHDEDGLVRRLPTLITAAADDGPYYPSMAVAALQLYLGVERSGFSPATGGELRAAGRAIPVATHGEMIIHYAGPPAQAPTASFTIMSYQDVLAGRIEPDLVADKIVLIGMMATAEPDSYLTPVSAGRPMFGVEIIANAIETIWSGRFITRPSTAVILTTILLLTLATSLLAARPWLGLLSIAGLGLVYFVAVVWLFSRSGVMLDLFYPLVAMLTTYVLVTAYRLSAETRRRQAVNLAPESLA